MAYGFSVNNGNCAWSLVNAGAGIISDDESCKKAEMYKNCYTYLYGLPMKLKEEGVIISETAEHKTVMGKDYWVLKATYEAYVGNDIWYFNFDLEPFTFEVYQFYKTDEYGNLKFDSVEYQILTETGIINQIKMSKVRAWYDNKDGFYLATGILKQ